MLVGLGRDCFEDLHLRRVHGEGSNGLDEGNRLGHIEVLV